jgi:hypothetical protein
MPLALAPVVADDGADGGHGVVIEEDGTRSLEVVTLEQANYLWYRRIDRTPLLAERTAALKAAVCLLDDVQ